MSSWKKLGVLVAESLRDSVDRQCRVAEQLAYEYADAGSVRHGKVDERLESLPGILESCGDGHKVVSKVTLE